MPGTRIGYARGFLNPRGHGDNENPNIGRFELWADDAPKAEVTLEVRNPGEFNAIVNALGASDEVYWDDETGEIQFEGLKIKK